MKVVINKRYGGFGITKDAAKHMAAAGNERAQREVDEHDAELSAFRAYRDEGKQPEGNERERRYSTGMWDISIKYGKEPDFHGMGYVEGMDGSYERHDPTLVAAVEALGEAASNRYSRLVVVEIPDGVEYEISEYDGNEHVAEKHRVWS